MAIIITAMTTSTVIRSVLLAGLLVAAGYGAIRWRVGASATEVLARAEMLLDTGQPGEARQSLAWLLYFNPRHAAARLIEGRANRQAGDLEAARRAWEMIPNDVPQASVAQLQLALVLIQESRLQEGEAKLRQLLEQSSDPAAIEELQWLLFNQFRPREVETLLETQFSRHPDRPILLKHLLLSELKPPVPQEGLKYILATNERQPGQAMVLRGLGYCSWRMGQVSAARTYFEEALSAVNERTPRHERDELRWTVAEFLLEQGAIEATAELCPPSTLADDLQGDRDWFVQSLLSEARDNLVLALEQLNEAVVRRPFELRYVQKQGSLLQRLGHEEKSVTAFRHAKQLEESQLRLTEYSFSHDLGNPTPDLCQKLAALLRLRGRELQADGWAQLAKTLPGGR